jgi:HD-like signal output (HDOD) protein
MGRNLIEEALRGELVLTFADPDYRPPPLPSVIVRLSQMAHSHTAGVPDVVRLLEQDQMLAGIVLRRVSSPLYAVRTPIATLHQAVVALGLKTLLNVVFEAVVRRGMFNLPEYRETLEQIGRHGTVTAYVAKLVCESVGVDGESAFICGLLHDVGFSALLLSATARKKVTNVEALWQDFDRMHERASNLVARLWNLPPETCDVLGHHHQPERDAGTETDTKNSKVAAAVCVADALTERFGARVVWPKNPSGNLVGADGIEEASVARARTLLGLDDKKVDEVVKKAERLVPEILSA